MKILNIDQFASVKRQIVFKGVTHDVHEVSVQQFIDNLKAAEDLDKAGAEPDSLSKQLERSIAAIHDVIPTLSVEELRKLPIEAVATLLKFIRGEMDPDGAANDAESSEAPKAATT